MCCNLFILYFHFYVACYLCVKCTSHLIEKKKKILFSTLIFFNLPFMVTREFLSSFNSYLRFTNLSSIVSTSPVLISTTSTSLLLASSLSEASSFRSPHSFLRYSATKGRSVEVALDWKFQLNIFYMIKKRLSND